MNYSINNSVTFSAINWNSFEGRPQINEPMTFCKEDSWDSANAKCCMDGYSIEHVLDETRGSQKSSLERKFLDQYPCVNGVELESLADKIQGDKPSNPPKTSSPIPEDKPCDIGAIQAFLKTAKKFGFGNYADIYRLEKEPKMSCDTLLRMAFRYGALAFDLGRDPQKKLTSKTF